MIDPAFLITAFVSLFVVIDPIGLTPLFVTLTQGTPMRVRRSIALGLSRPTASCATAASAAA